MNQSIAAWSYSSPFEELQMGIANALQTFKEKTNGTSSSALSPIVLIALANDLPARLSYSIKEASLITGLSIQQLYYANDNGDLEFFLPAGAERGARIKTSELERWFLGEEC